ncbi:nitroreductase/quinone reductase family protein [Pseudonocardia sp.]|uniref:nitroreductase/quinone reductase family protein n=1 Tax=Pseudonocardia sp. TaxID=60912 RepID=UPI00261272AA|nr:nitroreductase/quinone reductase family protein [Pseudonocardia sp.]
MPNAVNDPVIAEFRAHHGRVGGWFADARLLLLTTTGARTGAPHTVPLGYLPDGGERVLVIGSAGGGPHHPAWLHNLRADPRAVVEDGVFTYPVEASILEGEERDAAFARAAEADPGWGAYQDGTTRVLPVVAQLRMNCLTLCAGLRNHHGGEDAAIFPFLDRTRPDLAPVLERLRREHEEIAVLTARLAEVLAEGGAEVAVQVDLLVDDLERHLAYEEEELIPVLDGGR